MREEDGFVVTLERMDYSEATQARITILDSKGEERS